MKVGLVRHFKVLKEFPKERMISQENVMKWFDEYDYADVEPAEVDLGGIHWHTCYTSDLPRAVTTSERIFKGEVIQLSELREIKMYPIFKPSRKLPFLAWAAIIRLAWAANHKSQLEKKEDIIERINNVLDRLLNNSEENVLIVGHGALMIYMHQEILKRGFKGPKIRHPRNGELYLYEKK
ncbi:histidine phosphatase family protein [Falsibacillus pallidus]|uniref:histidine phosphatase family protein n=1 Tax=Falsibacillus pallidus TaxID=493781 RepID=UPI003D967243